MRLTREEVDTLARFNAERGRGLVHTEEWAARMAALQRRFDAQYATQSEEQTDDRRALHRGDV